MLGYWVSQELQNAGVAVPIAVLITQVVVGSADVSRTQVSARVGPGYTKLQIEEWAGELGYQFQEAVTVTSWCRVVPQVSPKRVVELSAIDALLRTGHHVVCAGSGGIPVVLGADGRLPGIDAVIAPNETARLLASELHADRVFTLTDEHELADLPD
jgi:carbamate kinase